MVSCLGYDPAQPAAIAVNRVMVSVFFQYQVRPYRKPKPLFGQIQIILALHLFSLYAFKLLKSLILNLN